MEKWERIQDTNYEVSNFGNIRSINFHREKRTRQINQVKFGKYYSVQLCINSKKMCYFVHRLVAQAFVPNPNNLPEIDHIDGNPENNRADNLRWCTHKENCNNPITRKRLKDLFSGEKSNWYGKRGKDNHNAKAVVQLSRNMEFIAEYGALSDAERLGFDRRNVSACCRGKIKFTRVLYGNLKKITNFA